MNTWLSSRWDALRGTFWFVPLIMVFGAFVLSVVTLRVDRAANERGVELTLPGTAFRGPEGSRAILATIAGSMITIASLSFSITIVALQQASSQYGPRLLHNFMRDRGNQVVLGTFISGFTYCLLVLRTVNGTDDHRFVPHLSVTVGLVSGLAGVGVLIYFLHHAATSIQAENVIAGVSRELDQALDRLFPSKLGEEPSDAEPDGQLPEDFAASAVVVPSHRSDYIQALDADRLMHIATEHDLVLKMEHRPGQFVMRGGTLARVWPRERAKPEVVDAVRGAFYLGPRRTPLQDAEFAIDQLVEVALRALSPGINDPFTAIACVDRLGAALCGIAEKKLPTPFRFDAENRLRVVADADTADGIVDAAFHQIRQAGRGNAAVTIRLLETIAAIAPVVRTSALREALLAQASVIHQGSQEGLSAEVDRAAARERYETLLAGFSVEAPSGQRG